MRASRILLWLVWCVAITAPLVWVRLDYDWERDVWRATVRADRWQLLVDEAPQWLGRHLGDLGLATVLIGAVIAVAWLWRRPAWVQVRSDLERRTRGKYRDVLVAVVVMLVLVLACRHLGDMQLEWAIMAGMYVVLALGLNLIVGMTGLLVLGYAGFMAVGAYTFAVLHQHTGITWWAAMLPAAAAGAVTGFLLGLPSLRLRGDYLAIVTLGFGETVRFLIKNLVGEQSIIIRREARVPALMWEHPVWRWLFPDGLSRLETELWIVALMVAGSIWMMHNLTHSRIGRAWIAIREDETAAAAMGIPTVQLKLLAFVIGAVWASVMGVFFVAHNTSANPEMFGFGESVLILSMVVLGGMGSGPGPIVGALVLYLVPEVLRERFPALISYRPMLVGAVMVAMMVFRPQGLVGSLRRKIELTQEGTAR
ncbi:MAG: branched-chain amino acid ABC transporter permease [Verrucomicrobiae bacterium]|nr:branched-chain amino acid ABC transporter permease [Verrucomicrobiae bacterium]